MPGIGVGIAGATDNQEEGEEGKGAGGRMGRAPL